MNTDQQRTRWQQLLPPLLRNFHTWLITLPRQLLLLVGAGVALNVASDLGNSFGTTPRFGGPWVAWGTLLTFLFFFVFALLATIDDHAWSIARARLFQSAWISKWLRYPLLVLVLWTALQSLGVIAHMPHTLASPHNYGSDEMYFAHYNAWLLLHGQNPYGGDHLAGALTYFHVDNVTLLRTAPYQDPLHPPTKAQTAAIVAAYLAQPHAPAPQLAPATTHSYPALSFLIALPSVWAGLPTIGYMQVLGLLALIVAIIVLAPLPWRWAIATLCLFDVDGIRSVAGSDFAIWTVAGIALVWILGSSGMDGRDTEGTEIHGKHGIVWAAIALGFVCSVQQTAWFFAPFYLVWVWRTRGLQTACRDAAIAVGTFLLINLPWMVLSPGQWLHSLLLPMTLPLYPTGGGLIGLGLSGALPLWPPVVYTVLEALAFVGLLMGYARWFQSWPYAGLIVPLLPLLLAWRSPSRYFILLPLLAILAVVLAWRAVHANPKPAHRPAAV